MDSPNEILPPIDESISDKLANDKDKTCKSDIKSTDGSTTASQDKSDINEDKKEKLASGPPADWQADVSVAADGERSAAAISAISAATLSAENNTQNFDGISHNTDTANNIDNIGNSDENDSSESEKDEIISSGPPADWQADVSIDIDPEDISSIEEIIESDNHIDADTQTSELPADSDEISRPPADWQAEPEPVPVAAEKRKGIWGVFDSVKQKFTKTEAESDTDEQTTSKTGRFGRAVKTGKAGKTVLPPLTKKAISLEGFITLAVVLAIFVPIGAIMGFSNMMQTLFYNGLDLLTGTCFFLLAVSVVIGALSSVLSEFGTVSIFNKALAPLMKPIYGMPGATSMAIFSSFMSDNPAVLTLASDRRYRRYFKKYQLATLTNIGTSFGMGLVVIALLLTAKTSDGSIALAIAMGVVGTLIGSVISTRLMLYKAKKVFGTTELAEPSSDNSSELYREIREGKVGARFISSLLDGGESGVKVGVSIIPGVLIIANLIMLLTNGEPAGGYTGGAGEGVALIPFLGGKMSWLFKVLFGFSNSSAISVPLTALGSAGAAITLIIGSDAALFTANELAVFTAMCMFWSGYLSTHVAMMDGMGFKKLTGWSILFHTIAGIAAGVAANYLYQLVSLLL